MHAHESHSLHNPSADHTNSTSTRCQIGTPTSDTEPKRIDLLTSVDGVTLEACYDDRVIIEIDGTPVPFIDLVNLRRNKRASGRPQDLADLAALDDPDS